MKKLILFELNEVPFRVVDSFCEAKPDSCIAELLRKSTIARTASPDTNWLHPWCTWPTLHRGVDTTKHMLTNLSQDLSEVDEEFPPIWKLLASQGARIGLGGSLHSWPMPTDLSQYAFYLPDTFASDPQAHPAALKAFQKFNLAMVDKSARNVSRGIAINEAVGLAKNLRELGFSVRTARDVALQLANEMVNPARKGRRRIFQSVLSFDVFMRQLVLKRPDFATFFTNHVASSMHRYWVAKFPDDFGEHQYDNNFIQTYAGEIDFAMGVADTFLRRLKTFIDKNQEYAIAITSSMGQAASQGRVVERQVFIEDAEKFMKSMGIFPSEFVRRRVMAPRFAVTVEQSKLNIVRKYASDMKLGNEPVRFEERSNGFCMFHFGHEITSESDEFITMQGQAFPLKSVGLKNTKIEDTAGSTGYHIPDGILVVYDPKNDYSKQVSSEIGTTELAPMLLKRFGVKQPAYMREPSSSIF